MDISKIPDKLNERINKALDNFLDIHSTKEILELNRDYLKGNNSFYRKFDFINQGITWYTTEEGGYFYYFLNLRWIILLSYIIHEYSEEYDDYCLGQINRYLAFAAPPFLQIGLSSKYTSVECRRMYCCYLNKIKKIKEIFGN